MGSVGESINEATTPQPVQGSSTNGADHGQTPEKKKQWIMNAFAIAGPGHLSPGLWKHPNDRQKEWNSLEYWIDLAKILDEGNFHGLFFADVLGIYDVYKGPANKTPALTSGAQFPILDPTLLIPALTSHTKNLTFAVTASTTYDNPYALARRFGTLDHITKGRVGINIVTSYLDSAAKGFGLKEQIPHDQRYEMADEFLNVASGLWESTWRSDAVVADTKTGVFTDPARVRNFTHEGKYYNTDAPLTVSPSPQRTPFIFQAGASKAGSAFATKWSEAMFLPGMEPEKIRVTVDNIRSQAVTLGRDPSNIKLIAGMLIVVDETDAKAQAKYEEYLSYADFEGVAALFGGWTGTDLSKLPEDEDFSFSKDKPGAIQSLINSWSATIPNSGGIKWTRRRILQEIAMGGVHARAIGSPTTVADLLENFIAVSGLDGFNLNYATSPGTFQDMVKYLWPELRKRGVFWDGPEQPGLSTRETYLGDGRGPRVRPDHPAAKLTWNAE